MWHQLALAGWRQPGGVSAINNENGGALMAGFWRQLSVSYPSLAAWRKAAAALAYAAAAGCNAVAVMASVMKMA
jgi:hypothetical protein